MQKRLLDYYRTQQSSLQWDDFLKCMAAELSSQVSGDELRVVFSNIGKRQAIALEEHLQGIDGLSELESSLNQYWSIRNWGFATFSEKKNSVAIVHAASPLTEIFGEDSLVWSIGFLEGFYEQVFKSLGAGPRMRVTALDAEQDGLCLIFELAE